MSSARSALLSLKRLFTTTMAHATTFTPSAARMAMQQGTDNPKYVTIAQIQGLSSITEVVPISGVADLTGLDTNNVFIDDPSPITSFPVTEGEVIKVRFDDSQLLTYHSTNLPIVGNASVTTVAGDIAIVVGGAGNVGYIQEYIRKSGKALIPPTEIGSGRAIIRTDASNKITSQGDIDSSGNDTTLTVNDLTRIIQGLSGSGATAVELYLGGSTGVTKLKGADIRIDTGTTGGVTTIGDYAGVGGLTKIEIDDTAQTVNIVAVKGIKASGREIFTREVVAKTADYTLNVVTDDRKIFTNTGTAVDLIFTLPDTGDCVAGKTRFTFRNYSGGSYRNTILVAGTDHLYFVLNGTAYDITGGGQTQDDRSSGSFMTVEYHGGGIWGIEASSDNWN